MAQCFTGETKVMTEEGLIAIEEIEIGDYVLAEDTVTGEQEYKEVLNIFVSQTNKLVHVTTTGNDSETNAKNNAETTINTTDNHPFYVEGKGWVPAIELEEGDVLRTADGETEAVKDVTVEYLEDAVLINNLEIEGYHTYFVSDESVLVHNTCDTGDGENVVSDDQNKGNKRGPKPKGTGPHNEKIEEIAGQISDGKVIAGGGRGYPPEAIISTPNGLKSSRRPDILIQRSDGSVYGINVGRTTSKGAPVLREVQAIYDLEDAGIPMYFVGYD